MSKIIKWNPACTAVSAPRSALSNHSGQNTFYFLPSVQRCLPLWVNLLKPWLKGGVKDGGTKEEGRERRRDGRGVCGEDYSANSVYTDSTQQTDALPAQASDEAEHTHMPHKSAKHSANISSP